MSVAIVPDDFSTIQKALDDASQIGESRHIVIVKAGTYVERLTIDAEIVTATKVGPSYPSTWETDGEIDGSDPNFKDLGRDFVASGVVVGDKLLIVDGNGSDQADIRIGIPSEVIFSEIEGTAPEKWLEFTITGFAQDTTLNDSLVLDLTNYKEGGIDKGPWSFFLTDLGIGPNNGNIGFFVVSKGARTPVTIRGNSKPIVDATGSDYGILVSIADVVIQDLDIRNATLASIAQQAPGNNLKANRCTLRDSPRGYINLTTDGSLWGLKVWNTEIFAVTTVGVDVNGLAGDVSFLYLSMFIDALDDTIVDDSAAIRVDSAFLNSLLIKNCIFMVRETDRTARCLQIGIPLSVKWEEDRNLLWPTDGAITGQYATVAGGPYTESSVLGDWRLLTSRDQDSIEADPQYDRQDLGNLFLRHQSPAGRSAFPVGVTDPNHGTDEDWAGVIRAVDAPSMGAHEIHDTIPLKGMGRILAIIGGLVAGPLNKVVLGEDGLEDQDDIFRPTHHDRGDGGFLRPFFTGGVVTPTLVAGNPNFASRVQVTPVSAYALAHDRKINHMSEIALADRNGGVVTARRVRAVPVDPLLPSYTIEFNTKISLINVGTEPVRGLWTFLGSASASSPAKRNQAYMAYDSDRDKVVLFGGISLPTSLRYNDTWEFDPQTETWEEVTIVGSPPSVRFDGDMVYDKTRKKFILFGGQLGTPTFLKPDETWEYDPVARTWTLLNPSTKPAGRFKHGMTYDEDRGVVVMFGGSTQLLVRTTETWEFDGTNWGLYGGSTPSGRQNHHMGYDSINNRTLMFSGDTGGIPHKNDLWGFNGVWTEIVADGVSGSPAAIEEGAADFGAGSARFVVFGGHSASSVKELKKTHERNVVGAEWTVGQSGSLPRPATRRDSSMAHVGSKNYYLLFGGFTDDGVMTEILSDYWKYEFGIG